MTRRHPGQGKPVDTSRRRIVTGTGLTFAALVPAAVARSAVTEPAPPIARPGRPGAAGFIERAFAMKADAVASGDQGYGAVLVRDGLIIGQAPSRVVVHGDPTAHAEIEAIRDAARRSGPRLEGSYLYSTSRPCPMCEAAAYWAGVEGMFFGTDARDGGRPDLCG